jgi:hypothetical protein
MIDNEPAISAPDRMSQIVDFYLDIMDFAGTRRKRICWGTWRPGEPQKHDTEYDLLLPLFRRNEFWSKQGVEFIYGSHAYFDPNFEWQRHFLNFRQQIYSFRVCDTNGVKRPTTVLTEYGFSRWDNDIGLVPDGYIDLGYSAQYYAEALEDFLVPPEGIDDSHIVPVCIFAAGAGMGGGWHKFNVHNDAFYSNMPFIPFTALPTPDPIPTPVPTPTPVPVPVPDPLPSTPLKVSFNVHHELFDAEFKAMQPPVILTMAGSHHASRLAQEFPDARVIHRFWKDRTIHFDMSPDEFVAIHSHLAKDNVIIHTTHK